MGILGVGGGVERFSKNTELLPGRVRLETINGPPGLDGGAEENGGGGEEGVEESSLLRWLIGAPLPPVLFPSPLQAPPPLVLLLVTLPPSPSEDDTEDRWVLWLRGEGGQERSHESQ